MSVNPPDVQATYVEKARTWINTNRVAINALIPADAPNRDQYLLNGDIPADIDVETLFAVSEHVASILNTFGNQDLVNGFQENVSPLLAYVQATGFINAGLNANAIPLQVGANTYLIQYNSYWNGAINPDPENGFSYMTADGQKLETLGAEEAKAVETEINRYLMLNQNAQAAVIEGLSSIIAGRLLATDRDLEDQISLRDVRNVREGFLGQIGRVNPNNLTDILSIPAFYQALEAVHIAGAIDDENYNNLMGGMERNIVMYQEALKTFVEKHPELTTAPAAPAPATTQAQAPVTATSAQTQAQPAQPQGQNVAEALAQAPAEVEELEITDDPRPFTLLPDQKTIEIKTKQGLVHLGYRHDAQGEQGFSFMTTAGAALESDANGGPLKDSAHAAMLHPDLTEAFKNNMRAVFAQRLDEIDGQKGDKITREDLDKVRTSLINRGDTDFDDLIYIFSVLVFDQSVRGLNDDQIDPQVKTDFLNDFVSKEFASLGAAGQKFKAENPNLAQYVPGLTPPAPASAQPATSTVAEPSDAEKRLSANLRALYSGEFRQLVINVQKDFDIYPQNGFYENGTNFVVENYVKDLIKNDPTGYLARNNNRVQINGKYFEIGASDEDIYAFEIDPKTNQRKTDVQGVKLDVNDPHVAFTAYMDMVTQGLKKDITEHETRINSRFEKKIGDFLRSVGHEEKELREEALKLVGNNAFSKSGFEASAFNAKLKAAGVKQAEIDAFVTSMLVLSSEVEADLDSVRAIERDFDRAYDVFRLFNHMNGNDYSPSAHRDLLAGFDIRDSFFSRGAYDTIRRAGAGERIAVTSLYDESIPGQKESILAYANGRAYLTREQVYEYAQMKFDAYALKVLSGESDEAIAAKSEAEKAAILQHVTDAINGTYMRDGKPVYFMPYEGDFDIVFRSMGTPDLSDQTFKNRIRDLYDPQRDEKPDGYYAIHKLEKDEEVALFDAGKSLITRADLEASINAVIERRYPKAYDSQKENIRNGLLERVEGASDYNALHSNEKEVILGAILNTYHPELEGNATYTRLLQNYYEPKSSSFVWQRSGTPELNAQGGVAYDENGNSKWSGGFHGKYGGGGLDFALKNYVQYNSIDIYNGRVFDDPKAAEIFFHDGSNGQANFDLKYEDVVAKLKALDDGGAALKKFQDGMNDISRPNAYMYHIRLHLDDYREARNSKFRMQQQGYAAENGLNSMDAEAAAAANAPQNGPGGTGTVLQSDGNPDLSLKGEFDKNGPWPSGGIGIADLPAKGVRALKDRFGHSGGAATPSGATGQHLKATDASKPLVTSANKDLAVVRDAPKGMDVTDEKTSTPKPSAVEPEKVKAEGVDLEKIKKKIRHYLDIAGRDLTTDHERLAAQRNAEKTMKRYGLTEADVWSSTSAKDADVVYTDKKGHAGDVAFKDSSKATRLKIEGKQHLKAVKELAGGAFEKVGGLRGAWKFAKGAGKLTVRLLPLVGFGVAYADKKTIMDDIAPALLSAGLLKENALVDLESALDYHIGQSTADFSGAGGELYTTYLYGQLLEDHNLDWAAAIALKPALISESLNDYVADAAQIKRLHETYGTEAITKLYDTIAEKFGLTETFVNIEGIDQPIHIGFALRDENLREQLYAKYSLAGAPAQREALKEMEAINTTAHIAQQIIEHGLENMSPQEIKDADLEKIHAEYTHKVEPSVLGALNGMAHDPYSP